MISFTKDDFMVITGASSGIGRSTALLLNELGASIIAIARNKEKLEQVKQNAKYKDNFYIEIKDLSKQIDTLPDFIKLLSQQYAKLKGMVLSAGITQIKPIKGINLNEARDFFDINFFTQFFLLKGFCDKRNNIGLGSSAILISSLSGVKATKGSSLYSASKAALISLTKSASLEYKNTRINSISPADVGSMNTMPDDIQKQRAGLYKHGIGLPQDIANMCVFLLSDKAKWIDGSNFILDGGLKN